MQIIKLCQTRRIGDITEMPGNVVATTGNGYHNDNATNHVPYGDNHGHGHGHYHAMGEHHPLVGVTHEDNGCCGGYVIV